MIQLISRQRSHAVGSNSNPKRQRVISLTSVVFRQQSSMQASACDWAVSEASVLREVQLVTMAVRALIFSVCFFSSAAQAVGPAPKESRETLLLVVGAPGAAEFGEEFLEASEQWEKLAEARKWKLERRDQAKSDKTAREQLKSSIEENASAPRLWIVMLGHGTFSRNIAKFNLVGPDVSSKELKSWLTPVTSQIVLINCSSASVPFVPELADRRRIVLTATKSGSEYNYARFGKYFAKAASDLKNDIDHDKEVSLLEAFLAASDEVERFYQQAGRLSTEHALLNDNGDKAGTTADFYRGIRPAKESLEGKIDGALAARIILISSPEAIGFPEEMEARRTAIESEIDKLRSRKSFLAENDYLDQLEKLMLQLAELYDEAEEK